MTTTTFSAVFGTACISHGLLDGTRSCPHCDRQVYDLGDGGDCATLKAFRKAALKGRMRTFAIVGAVLGSGVQSLLTFAASGVFDVSVLSSGTACGAVFGAAAAWAARPLAQHRLDARLRP